MTTVVLGWDGLDPEMCRKFGVEAMFGGAQPIDTLVNEELDKPHTWELWPSMITGQRPADHGIHAEEYIEDHWANPVVRWAARLSKPIPDSIRWRVGRLVRGAGAEMAFEDASYYEDMWTVFDDYRSLPIDIPNYRSGADERFGIESDRGAELAEFMETGSDGSRRPTVAPETFAGRIAADASEKIGLVQHGIQQDYDVVFCWLAYLDTAGHVAPAIDESEEFLKDAYERAADLTARVRGQLGPNDTLICVSDHGLQDGAHTETACIGAWPRDAVADVEHVVDAADAINAVCDSGDSAQQYGRDNEQADNVQQRLEDLGYV